MEAAREHTACETAEIVTDRAGKYLTFSIGGEEFGIKVLKVREIMGVQDITAVPQTPHYVKGVINLRGKVIPVVDLRARFGLPEIVYTQRTCIIVVQLETAVGVAMVGVVVDSVSEVPNIAASEVEDTSEFGRGVQTPICSAWPRSRANLAAAGQKAGSALSALGSAVGRSVKPAKRAPAPAPAAVAPRPEPADFPLDDDFKEF